MKGRLVPQAELTGQGIEDLRREVRAFNAEQIAAGVFVPAIDCWGEGWNPAYTKALAARGWVGMTIPTEYGGGGRSFIERFAVTEELLAAGAPVSAHWVSDRQAGPSLLKVGTQEQKERFLPAIARGELFWAIGMSESESGSDLASVRTQATRVDGGWSISGTKLWTSGAHHAHLFFVLARSSPLDPAHRHSGLSQFIIELDSPGITISPVLNMSGAHHFNEVVLDEVFVPDGMVLGEIGSGWTQVTSELGFERSGPERFLSSFVLLTQALSGVECEELPSDPRIGAVVGRLFGLHHMSLAVAQSLQRGEDAEVSAAVVKLLGTRLEGDIIDLIDELTEPDSRAAGALAELLRAGVMSRPGFTIRGGTTEVLRGVVARGLGLR